MISDNHFLSTDCRTRCENLLARSVQLCRAVAREVEEVWGDTNNLIENIITDTQTEQGDVDHEDFTR